MIEFKILKQSKKSRARLGILSTPHGEVETPSLVPVATNASVKSLTADAVLKTKSQILIANTFHLHLRPGEKVVARAGGLHTFMRWPHPLMTDSGGYQVFSLGFGYDLQIGKIVKGNSARRMTRIVSRAQPKFLRITETGVYFRSPLDGQKIFIGPRESIAIQEKLGADIIFAFDECPPPLATAAYTKEAVERTHRWAKECLKVKRSKQALYGIVQGSGFKKLREESARVIGGMDFDGFGIGGDFGHVVGATEKVLDWVTPILPKKLPRHLLGVGKLEDIESIIAHGVDTFDCTVPTHYARRGIAFTSAGPLNLAKQQFLEDKSPLDKKCDCATCNTHGRNYLSHLVRAKELTAHTLLTFHNLYYFNTYVASIREKIKKGNL